MPTDDVVSISDDSSDSNTNSNSNSHQGSTSSIPEVLPKPRNTAVKKGAPAPQKPICMKEAKLLEGSRFLEDFNPHNSRREKNKRYHVTPKPKPASKKSLYDELGKIRLTKEDVCDCFELDCPGCHFPCETCNSQKCGTKCRQNRKWAFEVIEFDGGNNQMKTNPMLTTINNRN